MSHIHEDLDDELVAFLNQDNPPKGFVVRASNCLWNENIKTLQQLREMTAGELLRLPNFGLKSYQRIRHLFRKLDGQPQPQDDATAHSIVSFLQSSSSTERSRVLHRTALALARENDLSREQVLTLINNIHNRLVFNLMMTNPTAFGKQEPT